MEVTFDASVHTLYAVMAFIGAVMVFTIMLSDIIHSSSKKTNHTMIFIWVIFFCLQDGAWGLFASHAIKNDLGLTIVSYIFHLSAITSSTIWVVYFLSRIKGHVKHARLYLGSSIVLSLVQYGMLVGNLFTNFMFYVDEYGFYKTTDYRSIMFYIQLAEYIIIGIVTMVVSFRTQRKEDRSILLAIFAINFSPVFFGLLQMIYPDAPFDSIGFTVSCLIIQCFLSIDYKQRVRELQELRENLNSALAQAEAANRAKTSFLFNMSHDIRTPMNAITGFTNMAIKNIDNKEKSLDSMNKVKQSSDLLLSLINDVLEMSRIENGKTEPDLEPFDLTGYETDIKAVLKELAEAKDIDLQFGISELNDPVVNLDKSLVNRILLNLGGNAIKYTPNGGTVKVNLRQLPSEKEGTGLYEYTVTDNGIGISKEFQEHLFEEFSREITSTTSGIQGTGLGLAVTKAFVELMNGTITCESELGQGSKFTMLLPLEILSPSEKQSEDIIPDEDISGIIQGKTILLVEDNELNREIAVDILADLGDVTVETAENGSIALDLLKAKGPTYYDCILMDIQMPVMNGYEAAKAIRAMYPDSPLPIIALSANAFEEDRHNSLQAGMNDHLSKPIQLDKLKQILGKYLR